MTVRDIFNAVPGFDKESVVENVHNSRVRITWSPARW
jgi:hypothetical protein